LGQSHRESGLAQHTQHRRRETFGLIDRDEQAGLLVRHDARDATRGRGDDRNAGGERLDDDVGHVVHAGAVHEDAALGECRRDVTARYFAVKPNPFHAQSLGQAF